jgi:dienelactone hydrolase
MASNQPAQCCTVGVKHEGEPTGSMIKFGNIDAYLAKPTGKTVHKDAGIVICADVIGIWQNSQLLADQFATNGWVCLIPDEFNRDPIKPNRPEGFDLMSWISKGTGGGPHTTKEVDPIIEASIKYMKEELGIKYLGGVGYCFGAKYVIRYLNNKDFNVGYVAHPSFVEEDELKAISSPLSISAAETDGIFTVEKRHKSEEILKATGNLYQINLFSGVEHGFTVRCNLKVRAQKFAKEQAFYQAVAWFDEHLVGA